MRHIKNRFDIELCGYQLYIFVPKINLHPLKDNIS